jgi:hypothetical protein
VFNVCFYFWLFLLLQLLALTLLFGSRLLLPDLFSAPRSRIEYILFTDADNADPPSSA